MRGPSSSKQSHRRSTEVEGPKTKEEPPLSVAYIRSLVNQLSSSRPWEVANHPNSPTTSPMHADHREAIAKAQDQLQPPPQRPKKKQVRRRLHTSRPYQEKFLNMAEARREIVAALKLHRAAMKQASQQQQQNQPSHTLQLNPHKSPCNIYQSNSIVPSYNQPYPLFPSFTSASPHGACTPISPLPIGLNLNLQSFINIETPIFGNSSKPVIQLSSHSPSSSSNYSSSALPSTSIDVADVTVAASLHPSDATLHHAIDEEEMAEIRTASKKHEESNDTVNLVITSACWSKFLKNMEASGEKEREAEAVEAFGEAINMPAWLSDHESGKDGSGNYLSLKHGLDEFLQDVPLPCLDIEATELLEGEWLS